MCKYLDDYNWLLDMNLKSLRFCTWCRCCSLTQVFIIRTVPPHMTHVTTLKTASLSGLSVFLSTVVIPLVLLFLQSGNKIQKIRDHLLLKIINVWMESNPEMSLSLAMCRAQPHLTWVQSWVQGLKWLLKRSFNHFTCAFSGNPSYSDQSSHIYDSSGH